MKANGKMYDFDGIISCIKKAKPEPLEIGINGEYLAFRGLKPDMSDHFVKNLTEAQSRQNGQRQILKRQ